jgi:hypothetical protein
MQALSQETYFDLGAGAELESKPQFVTDQDPLEFERAIRQARHLIELGIVYPGIVSGQLPRLRPRVISQLIQHVADGAPKGGRLAQGFAQFVAGRYAARMLLFHLIYERFTQARSDDVDRVIETYQLFCYLQKVLFDNEIDESAASGTTLKRMLDLQRGIRQGELALVHCHQHTCRSINLTTQPARGNCHRCGTAL